CSNNGSTGSNSYRTYGRKSANRETVNEIKWLSIQGVRKNKIAPTAPSRGTMETVGSWIEVMTCPMLMTSPTTIAATRTGAAPQNAAMMVCRDNSTICSGVIDQPQ